MNRLTNPLILLAFVTIASTPTNALAQGMGMGRGNQQDMGTIHQLLGDHQKIKRTVTNIDNGVETLTEAPDPVVAAKIQEHALSMQKRLKEGRPIREWDPLFAELFKNSAKIDIAVTKTKNGVRIKETSKDPYTITLIQWHAAGVTGFVKEGMAGMHKEHPAPPKPGGNTPLGFVGVGDGVKTCPVTGEPVNTSVSAKIQGRTVYFCCPGCVETVKKDPSKYLKWAKTAPVTAGVGAKPLALQGMLGFDSIYIPTLSFTSSAQTEKSFASKAVASCRTLATRWPKDRASLLAAFPGDPRWAHEIEQVEAHIEQGSSLAAAGDFAGAHASLEEIRDVLMTGRKRNGMEYFIDRLTAFHEPMEAIVLSAKGRKPGQFSSTDKSSMTKEFAEAMTLWRGIKSNLPDARSYGLSRAQERQMQIGLSTEASALDGLSSALKGGTSAQILAAAKAIKPPFAKLFTAFGKF